MKLNYEDSKRLLKEELETTERLLKINNHLKKFNSFLITPYFQNYKINSLIKYQEKGELDQNKVSDFFIREFYDLSGTLSAIDGYFKQSFYISPHIYHIERSLILCFQKEYTGAINVIIPCIEGSISRYLTERNILTKDYDRYKKIRSFLKSINKELIERYSEAIKDSEQYNIQQKSYLIKLNRKCLNNWIIMLETFINESLFSNSKYNDEKNTLNRHIIFHSLEISKYDTLENYIKLFNSLMYINWFFVKIENNSIFNEIDSETFLQKRLYYENLIKHSEKTTTYKNLILKDYSNHSQSEFYREIKYESLYKDMSFKLRIILKLRIKLKTLIDRSIMKLVRKTANN